MTIRSANVGTLAARNAAIAMSDLTVMSTDEAIGVIARRSLRQAYEIWAEREDLWESEYPDFGESDVLWILDRMEMLFPRDPTLERFQVAHRVLADRAAGADV